ncbi:uncharacterized protein LY79DRAFT_239994 [Colletotrichum navitas]|uniref:Uncharacterized protein n=1 Tax=Colletotrichum navitas TaxID=681940 RepID=A0AAD8V4T2_9PEZI|nr:uncharacterized protein LY79DRAFT_239994 [Colletotrichum navitas]KAK1586104.1 hypothetical protein LY79DRAFT_239994 [Colletotrichum navitas]
MALMGSMPVRSILASEKQEVGRERREDALPEKEINKNCQITWTASTVSRVGKFQLPSYAAVLFQEPSSEGVRIPLLIIAGQRDQFSNSSVPTWMPVIRLGGGHETPALDTHLSSADLLSSTSDRTSPRWTPRSLPDLASISQCFSGFHVAKVSDHVPEACIRSATLPEVGADMTWEKGRGSSSSSRPFALSFVPLAFSLFFPRPIVN